MTTEWGIRDIVHRPYQRVSEYVPTPSTALHVSLLGLVLLVALAGCTTNPGQTPTGPGPHADETGTENASWPDQTRTTDPGSPQASDRKSGPPALSTTLYGLVNADNRSHYAATNDLSLRNESVFVTITLREGRELPTGVPVDIQARAGSSVDAYVPIDTLVVLARHDNTTSVTPPESPQPLDATGRPSTLSQR